MHHVAAGRKLLGSEVKPGDGTAAAMDARNAWLGDLHYFTDRGASVAVASVWDLGGELGSATDESVAKQRQLQPGVGREPKGRRAQEPHSVAAEVGIAAAEGWFWSSSFTWRNGSSCEWSVFTPGVEEEVFF